jgi:hypothetical protein
MFVSIVANLLKSFVQSLYFVCCVMIEDIM